MKDGMIIMILLGVNKQSRLPYLSNAPKINGCADIGYFRQAAEVCKILLDHVKHKLCSAILACKYLLKKKVSLSVQSKSHKLYSQGMAVTQFPFL